MTRMFVVTTVTATSLLGGACRDPAPATPASAPAYVEPTSSKPTVRLPIDDRDLPVAPDFAGEVAKTVDETNYRAELDKLAAEIADGSDP